MKKPKTFDKLEKFKIFRKILMRDWPRKTKLTSFKKSTTLENENQKCVTFANISKETSVEQQIQAKKEKT